MLFIEANFQHRQMSIAMSIILPQTLRNIKVIVYEIIRKMKERPKHLNREIRKEKFTHFPIQLT